MNVLKKISVSFATLLLVTPFFSFKGEASRVIAATTQTGYTKADDVVYNDSGNYIANWGARDENCVFLSKYATAFYTGNYTYEVLSQKAGSKSNAPSSDLYSALYSLMSSKQTYQTSYDATRSLFCYTDCVNSNYSKISSFYSGTSFSGTWDDGATWNREHTWPDSKGNLAGKGENDIMMLRPTKKSENGSRGNKAYGESSGYYDPNGEGQELRGDCARIVLYQYVRWKCINTGSKYNPKNIFGTDGVIESLDVMLRWMEEDPVDTWEMGRNDAVQSITGTRNVFVDYPEYAWLLFGEEVPDDMTTPSGKAKSNVTTPPSTPSTPTTPPTSPDSTDSPTTGNDCEHDYNDWYVLREATETTDGKQMRTCLKCGRTEEEILPKTGTDSSGINLNCSATALPTATLFAAILTTGACIVKKRKK